MSKIDLNTVLTIKGKRHTIEDFKAKFGIDTDERAIQLAERLVKKGQATIYHKNAKEKNIVDTLESDELLESIVDQINDEEYSAQVAVRESNKADVDLVSIRLAFKTTNLAVQAEQWINSLGIEDTEISMKKGAITLTVRDITPAEHTKIARKYQLERAITTGVNVTGKALKNTTDAINYTATNVVAPVAKIASEAGMNLGKGLVHTGVKVGAGLVNATSKAVTDTKVAMATDTELLKAKRELVDAKDTALSFFRNKFGTGKKRSGIEVID